MPSEEGQALRLMGRHKRIAQQGIENSHQDMQADQAFEPQLIIHFW